MFNSKKKLFFFLENNSEVNVSFWKSFLFRILKKLLYLIEVFCLATFIKPYNNL